MSKWKGLAKTSRKLLFIYHASSLLGIGASAAVSVVCLTAFLARNPEDALGTVSGTLKDARAVYAAKQADNRLEFRFEKVDQLFIVPGVNTANLQYFLNRESPGSELTALVTSAELGNPEFESLTVHELKSKRTTYLKLSSRLKDQQRWQSFAGVALAAALGLLIWLLLRLRKKLGLELPEVLAYKAIDPLVILGADALKWIPAWLGRRLPILAEVRAAKVAYEASLPARPQTQKPTHMKALQLLMESGRIDARDPQGRTPLQIAAAVGQTEVVAALLNLFANPDNVDLEGTTPIMAAVRGKHLGVVLKILDFRPDLSIKNLEGKSAVDIATELGQEAIVQVLNKAAAAHAREALLK